MHDSERYSVNRNLMVSQVGILKADAFRQIVEEVINILRAGLTP